MEIWAETEGSAGAALDPSRGGGLGGGGGGGLGALRRGVDLVEHRHELLEFVLLVVDGAAPSRC